MRFLAALAVVIVTSSVTSAECERELKKLRAELSAREINERAEKVVRAKQFAIRKPDADEPERLSSDRHYRGRH